MDTEIGAALIGGVCTLLGVAVGALGTLAAARVQVKGAQAQADATLAQAHATYRAALDQAHAVNRAAHEQWRRGARRDAYGGFVTALDEVQRLATAPEHLDVETDDGTGPLAAAGRVLRAARTVVDLEGPAEAVTLARLAQEQAVVLAERATGLAPRAVALRRLSRATDSAAPEERETPDSSAALALEAHRALTLLREAAFQHENGRVDVAHYAAAQQRAAAAVEACGLFTVQQRRALLSDPTWDAALRAGRAHSEAAEAMQRAREAFVAAAAAQLEPAATGGGPGLPHPRTGPVVS